MGGNTGRFREEIKNRLKGAGALAVGFAEASPVEESRALFFDRWLESGRHAGMDYLASHGDLRKDPRLLLEGARTVISMAFSYNPYKKRESSLPHVSKYALLPDYHKWIRKLIRRSQVGELLGQEHRDWRICVDSAPIFERYWAWKSGIAMIGENGAAILPGIGCEVFLAEIITIVPFEADLPNENNCGSCGRCQRACPTGALTSDGIDCNRCISYLTIEHRGNWNSVSSQKAMSVDAARETLFGCDRCTSVCPHNNDAVTSVIVPIPEMLTYEEGPPPLSSPLKRAGEEGLRRNRANLCPRPYPRDRYC